MHGFSSHQLTDSSAGKRKLVVGDAAVSQVCPFVPQPLPAKVVSMKSAYVWTSTRHFYCCLFLAREGLSFGGKLLVRGSLPWLSKMENE